MTHKLSQVFVIFGLVATSLTALGQDAATESVDETAKIEEAIQSYIAAFNARDVEKLVAHWSPDGVYISRSSGERVVGREPLAEEFKAMFAGERVPKLAGTPGSIDFISPNVALERGTATVAYGEEEDVIETEYSVVYVKRDGVWLIDRVTEDQIVVEPTNYERLKGLEWLIGEWVDAGEGVTIDIDCTWTKNQNFICRRFAAFNEGEAEADLSGLQIIGWDAKEKQIRSWLFDSSGGVITGTWTERDDHWTVQSVATLADGTTGSFTSVFRPLEDGSHTWQKINQVLDGKLLPNIDEVVVRRK